ncbi:hypothetical protein L227DRAFT_502476 [Lentinus tigrinus ALCF2SS1-6]|uniref:Uncharacterized protein n=2 Tax=Lentinus tigrinus TaxID=5365 RepID=A0A5C2SA23_9APHY|nr:hypothetical protein L227DRAFT_502476 [Lentinus tigrinus ALCF2SS1-6]
MGKCRDLLSPQPNPLLLTVRDIRNRYHFWKTTHVLNKMSSTELSSLICLLGTLSISEYGHPQTSSYTHPRASQMQASTFAPHWAFIEEIVGDKHRLRYSLLPSDHYWLMRAYLVQSREHLQNDPSKARQMLTKVEKQYFSLCATTSDPDVYVSFFDALAASPPALVHQFATSLLKALHTSRYGDETNPDAFFHLVLRCGNQLSGALKEELLHAVGAHVARTAKVPFSLATGGSELAPPDIDLLVAALASALFSPGGAAAEQPAIRWSIAVASRLFNPDSVIKTTIDVRWNYVLLLALARTRATDGAGQVIPPAYDPVQQAAVVEWRTVCVLAAMENLFRSTESGGASLGDDVVRGFSQVVRRVWREWTTVHPSVAPPRTLLVTRIICASFLRLGGQLKDKALVEVCRDFCVAAGLWSVRETRPETETGLQLLASEQLYASLVCGTFFERALVDLMVYTNRMHVLRSAVDTAIVRYSRTDPEHAQELVAWARSRAVQPSDTVVAAVGVALAKHGISGFLDRYLNDALLGPELRAKVVSVHLQMYMRYGRRFLDPADVVERMKPFFVLAAQLQTPNPLLRRLRGVLLTLVQHQCAPKVVKIVEDVSGHHSLWFSALFYTRILRALLEHRQFRLAQRTLSLCSSKHPENAERWTSLVLFKLHRVRAKRIVFRLMGHSRLSRNALMALVRSRARRSDPIKATSRTTSLWMEDTHSWRQTVHALVLKGRFVAAKQLFSAVRDRASPSIRTSIGNTILHGYILRRSVSNRRRAEMVVNTYREFKEQYGFVPDHVTVNILLKAQLRCTEDVDALMARQLFDVLIRRGYPTGSGAAMTDHGMPDPPPFGMQASPVETVIVGQLELPKVGTPLQYKSHVRPLYKMFVTAFYQRGDVAAGRKVVGIMKALEAQGWGSSRRV